VCAERASQHPVDGRVYFGARRVPCLGSRPMSLLPIHIVAGALAITLGATALLAPKGRVLHRRAGAIFVYALLTMGISGSILATKESLTNINVLGGFMCAYFVLTAYTAVRPASVWTRRLNVIAIAIGLVVGLIWVWLAVKAATYPQLTIPFFMVFSAFLIGAAMLVGVSGDFRVMRSGMPRGRARIARHLWRMCFALFIAVGSFIAIPERVAALLPDIFATPVMRGLAVGLVFYAMFYWLWRIRHHESRVW
jgi:uncharacterized membrane protein